VEDDADDAFFFTRAWRLAGRGRRLHVLPHGQAAKAYFEGAGDKTDRGANPLPVLLVTDLKMGGMDGFDLIRFVRSQPSLRALPIVVLTSSGLDRDRQLALSLGANEFMVKPGDLGGYNDVVVALERWGA
jgi:two-component system response regulator